MTIKYILLCNLSHPDFPTMQIAKNTVLTKEEILIFLQSKRAPVKELFNYCLKKHYFKKVKI